MSPFRRSWPRLLARLVTLAVLGAGLPPAARSAAAASPGPSLAVVVSVDGLAWRWLDHYRPWYAAGLKRLLEESQVEAACGYRHLNTETGPGHAALSTGAPPRVTGIMANHWFEQQPDGSIRSLSCVDQPAPEGASGPGPGNLRVPTLGDRLAETRGGRVVSLSAKDRSAIFLAGRQAKHAVYWFDQESGRFTTSAGYDPPAAARAVVGAFNRTSAGAMLPARFGTTWSRLPPPEPPTVLPAPRPTPAPGLLDYQLPTLGLGWDHTLLVHPRGYFAAFYYTPFVDDLVTELALAFVADEALGLGRRSAPDLLLLSLSAQDLVSHSYGAESEEGLDTLRRLDLHLGRLLEALERSFPKGGVVLALSADHGFPPIPEAERTRDPSHPGGRLLTSDRGHPNFLERLNRLVAEELCLDPLSRVIHGSDGFNLVYNRPGLPMRTIPGACGPEGAPVGPREVDRALTAVVRRHYAEEIESVYLVSDAARWPADAEATEYVRNDFDLERSGDAFFVPRRGVMTHWDPARGAMHGSHHDYDTHVPLLFWGAPFARRVSTADTTPYDLAPTLAALLGIDLPDAVGRSRVPAR